jgi:hypothetical protein
MSAESFPFACRFLTGVALQICEGNSSLLYCSVRMDGALDERARE